MTFLYADGCSLTHGAELGDREHQAWPAQLSRMMDWEDHHNAGTSSSANSTIAERTIRWITLDWIRRGRSPDDLFVVINWSHPYRYALPCQGRWMTIIPENTPSSDYDSRFRRLWFDYVEDMFCPNQSWFRFIQQVLMLQCFFKTAGVSNYLMTTAIESPSKALQALADDPRFDQYEFFLNGIDTKRFLGMYEPNTAMLEWLHQQGYKNFAEHGHPREDGHRLWAERLSKKIREMK